MSKLKPMSDDKELAAVPQSEAVLVELEPPTPSNAEVEEPEPEPVRKRAEKDEPDAGPSALEKQLLASQEAERLARERADTAERDARTARQERDEIKTASADTEKELLVNSLTSAQAEESAAQAEFEKAFEAGDAKAMAAAQSKIGRAAAKVLNYEGAVAQFETEAKVTKEAPERPEPQVDIVTAIDRDPKLMPKEREWLKAHPEVLTDTGINAELSVGYARALRAGHRRGTEAYFQYLDEFLGYAEPARANTEDGGERNEERASVVSAPVSRDNRSSVTNQRLTPTQVKLTPQQREMAALSGLSDIEYARGLQQMHADKSVNPEKYAAR